MKRYKILQEKKTKGKQRGGSKGKKKREDGI
jgi:hypothetical protein